MFKKILLTTTIAAALTLFSIKSTATTSNTRGLQGATIKNGSAILTLPTSTDTMVGRATTDTLTNKTLTSPVINTPTGIVKGDVGLGNVDNTSDATKNSATATLTNKTLTSPVINSPTGIVKADVGLGNVDNTSDATKNSATATLTNKTLTSPVINTPSIDVQTLSHQTTPSNPSSGNVKFYSKNDNKVYVLNSSGTETEVGASTGSVSSNATSSERIERATITNSGTASITSQSGTWLSSVSRTAAGVVSHTVSGSMFSATPTCVCTVKSASHNRICQIESASTSTIVTSTQVASSNTDTDVNFELICMGTK